MSGAGHLTVGVTTRNRLRSLVRCVSSIGVLGDLVTEVIVVDDTSDEPVEGPLRAEVPREIARKLKCRRLQTRQGYIVARNIIMSLAANERVLLLDDDTCLTGQEGLQSAIDVMQRDGQIAAIACAQAEATGEAWPATMQASPASYACYVPSFIGFAHVLSRSAFQSVGGYRESFHFYGEEKDLSIRLMDAGYAIAYLPATLVTHIPDPAGRDVSKYLRYVIRNDCLSALYNDPWPRLFVSVPARLAFYFLMKRRGDVEDPGGFLWILGELWRLRTEIRGSRRPLRWATYRRWRALRRTWPELRPDLRQAVAARMTPEPVAIDQDASRVMQSVPSR